MVEYINTLNISHYKIYKILYDILSGNSYSVPVLTDDNKLEELPVITISSNYTQDKLHSDFSGAYNGIVSISCYHTAYNNCSLLVENIDTLIKNNRIALKNQGLSLKNKTISEILPFKREDSQNYVCVFDFSFVVNTNG